MAGLGSELSPGEDAGTSTAREREQREPILAAIQALAPPSAVAETGSIPSYIEHPWPDSEATGSGMRLADCNPILTLTIGLGWGCLLLVSFPVAANSHYR
jgi:hypothetical protein